MQHSSVWFNSEGLKVMLKVQKFSGSYQEIVSLADIYMRSYNNLSQNYKSEEEMALYTKGSFIKKLKGWAENQKAGKEPFIYVLYNNDKPCGIMRLNEIPASYRDINTKLEATEYEHGVLDNWVMTRYRKVQFVKEPNFTDNTLILNQIYMAPEAQKQGWGTYFMQQVIPELQKQGFEQFIVEYNDNNSNGKKFHEDVLCVQKIATTSDLDHITTDRNGKNNLCLSPVSIGISSFSKVLSNIAAKQQYFAAQGRGR